MVCDSTNVFVDGVSGKEADVRENLAKKIRSCKNRVIVATFASNIARLESIIRAGQKAGRHIAIAGRSLRRVSTAAKETGYLKGVEFINEREIGDIARQDILIICTGCQGEPLAALSKVARGEHPNIRLAAGDTVIFSSRKIPGNELKVADTYNALTRRNIEIITAKRSFVHVSGHPCRDELKKMYDMVRPQIAIPTHGEARHIREHAKFANALGVPETVEAKNGSVILLSAGKAMEIATVHSGYIAVDGNSFIATNSAVIKTRRKIRDDGCVVITIVINKDNELLAKPALTALGSIDANEDKELFKALRDDVERLIANVKPKDSNEKIAESIKSMVKKLFRDELNKKPVVEVNVVKI
jgi:ribonuclease J